MKSRTSIRLFVLFFAVVSLVPLVRLGMDWARIAPFVDDPFEPPRPRGFDWVQWVDDDGAIQAAFVFPQGPAYEAGIRRGDIFYELEYQQYFNADDLKQAVEGIPPGEVRTYELLRGEDFVVARVPISRYPTFVYPLSRTLWQASSWGFTLATFLHLLALIIVIPLSLRSRRAQASLLLITASFVWVLGSLGRILIITFVGPPDLGGTEIYAVYQFLTVASLCGWILFPALLINKVVQDAAHVNNALGRFRYALYTPTVILGSGALMALARGGIGPIPLDALIAPVLFHVSCYIVAASILEVAFSSAKYTSALSLGPPPWSRAGAVIVLFFASIAALSVLGVVPIFGVVTDTAIGWIIVAVQLVSVAPVALVTFATLRHGRVDQVISRAATYVSVLGLIFFTFVGGMTLLDPVIERHDAPPYVIAGLFIVILLILFERLARPVRDYGLALLATERQRARQRLGRFADRMRTILDRQLLLHETVTAVGVAMDTRSAVLFVRNFEGEGLWLSASYRPEPPYFTQRKLNSVWPDLENEIAIWAANPELNEARLPDDTADMLRRHDIALAIPVAGGNMTLGVLLIAPKRRKRSVYNLEDIETLRSVCGQLALAIERLNLLEREKGLIRESAEAHLVALRAQINPHFLFNALNTVSAFIDEKPSEAERIIENLATIFRYVLKTGSRPHVSLHDEWTLVRHYLEIEQSRFEKNLKVRHQIDPALRDFPVPAFAIQTLVENAVKHGIEKQRGGGVITIAVNPLGDDFVEIMVHDTGIGIAALFGSEEATVGREDYFGIGLRNVSARLHQLYGRHDLLRLKSAPGEGTTATLLIPVQGNRIVTEGTMRSSEDSNAYAKQN